MEWVGFTHSLPQHYTLIMGILVGNEDSIPNLLRRVFHSQIKIKCLMKISLSEKVRNGPDYFGGMEGGGCWGVMVIGSFKIAYNRYIFAYYHPTNIIWNFAKNSELR